MGTINYEVTCGLTARVPRVYHRDGGPASEPLHGTASASAEEAVRMGEDSTSSSR